MISAAIYLSVRQIAEDKTHSTLLTGGVHSTVGIALSLIEEQGIQNKKIQNYKMKAL